MNPWWNSWQVCEPSSHTARRTRRLISVACSAHYLSCLPQEINGMDMSVKACGVHNKPSLCDIHRTTGRSRAKFTHSTTHPPPTFSHHLLIDPLLSPPKRTARAAERLPPKYHMELLEPRMRCPQPGLRNYRAEVLELGICSPLNAVAEEGG